MIITSCPTCGCSLTLVNAEYAIPFADKVDFSGWLYCNACKQQFYYRGIIDEKCLETSENDPHAS